MSLFLGKYYIFLSTVHVSIHLNTDMHNLGDIGDILIWCFIQDTYITSVWRRYENMSPCPGRREKRNYERIASCAGCQCWTLGATVRGNSAAHYCVKHRKHSARTHLSKRTDTSRMVSCAGICCRKRSSLHWEVNIEIIFILVLRKPSYENHLCNLLYRYPYGVFSPTWYYFAAYNQKSSYILLEYHIRV